MGGSESDAAPTLGEFIRQPKEGDLALRLEEQKALRRRGKDKDAPYMTKWVSAKAINVPSVKAMGLNSTALECIAEWWCPTIDYPKSIPIDLLRSEVRGGKGLSCLMLL